MEIIDYPLNDERVRFRGRTPNSAFPQGWDFEVECNDNGILTIRGGPQASQLAVHIIFEKMSGGSIPRVG